MIYLPSIRSKCEWCSKESDFQRRSSDPRLEPFAAADFCRDFHWSLNLYKECLLSRHGSGYTHVAASNSRSNDLFWRRIELEVHSNFRISPSQSKKPRAKPQRRRSLCSVAMKQNWLMLIDGIQTASSGALWSYQRSFKAFASQQLLYPDRCIPGESSLETSYTM